MGLARSFPPDHVMAAEDLQVGGVAVGAFRGVREGKGRG